MTQSTEAETRAVRVIWLAVVLLHVGAFTADTYERRWGTSLRMFRRDLDSLRASGVRVEYEKKTADYRLIQFDAGIDLSPRIGIPRGVLRYKPPALRTYGIPAVY